MADDMRGKAGAEYRKNRVKKIKKIIVTICVVLLVLPTILSIFLMIKVFRMQGQIDTLLLENRQTETTVNDSSEEKADVTPTVQPTQEPTAQPAASGAAVSTTAVSAASNEKKKVYLTFDDGPGTQTAKILKILKKENVKATFFVTGKEDDYSKKMYRRIVKEGHTLGMHSYAHIYSDLYSSEKAFTKDLNKIYDLLYETTGVYPKFYRFPGGSSASGTDVPIAELIPILEKKGISYLDWNVISPDTVNASITKKKMIAGILEGVDAYETSIVLFYDVADRPMTVKALPEIIKQLKEKNCELLPVDETTVLIRHNK